MITCHECQNWNEIMEACNYRLHMSQNPEVLRYCEDFIMKGESA